MKDQCETLLGGSGGLLNTKSHGELSPMSGMIRTHEDLLNKSKGIQTQGMFNDDLPELSDASYQQLMVMPSKFAQGPNCEISKAQLLLLDKLNLQSIIDNKNMAHAITAMDLLRMEGIEVSPQQLPTPVEVPPLQQDIPNSSILHT